MDESIKAIYWQLLSKGNIVRRTKYLSEGLEVVIIGPAPGEYVPAIYLLKWLQ